MFDKTKPTIETGLGRLRWVILGVVLTLTVGAAIMLATGDLRPVAPEVEIAVQTPPSETEETTTTEVEPTPEPKMLARFKDLYAQNSDLVGWIHIPGTGVDYPVLQSPEDDWDFYLSHDFYREADSRGIPYIWPQQQGTDNDLLFVYAHNLPGGSMFSEVAQYRDRGYFEDHPMIEFSTLYEERRFEVAFVFYVWSRDDVGSYYYHPDTGTENATPFPYLLHEGWQNQEEFDYFIEQNRIHALYETGTEVTYGDRMLALWTCATTGASDLRLIVVAVEKQG
ncbi:MAG: class B sortase [Coriobacteriia bacterium]|nr:class B sortase [Coriobacteriia bacterium]MCL2746976.1 class B sortase [Coriobacteriia bacterium]MCL2870520.1 class B sortase [Coriobacteriia bacterium]